MALSTSEKLNEKQINKLVSASKNNNSVVNKSDTTTTLEKRSTADNSWAFINGYTYFQNLRDCGYCEVDSNGYKVSSGGNGICGYIAAGMLLSFDTAINGRGYVASSYLSSDGIRYSIKSSNRI